METSLAFTGQRPLRELWGLLARRGSSVLQIGPASGHLLAAARQAGCLVEAVEPSKARRDLMRDLWNIDAIYPSLDAVPAGRAYDTVVAVNALELVYDIGAFLGAVRELLAPGGTCYLSSPNAVSLEASVLGTWWPACKGHDQVSLPSPAGMATAAVESGLRVERIWSTGLPLEFPVSALTAARDRARAWRGREGGQRATRTADRPAAGIIAPAGNAALTNLYTLASVFDPGYRVLGAAGRAASLKARLVQPLGKTPR
jgi:SAM-dependent methyltransferase